MMRLLQKILIILAGFSLLVFIAILIAAWQMGAFMPIQVYSAERGPYFIVTFSEPESPVHMSDQVKWIQSYMQQKEYRSEGLVGVYYHDPLSVTMKEVEASAGCLVQDSVTVDSPFILISIEKQIFALAGIRINPILVPFKTYPVLQAWMKRSGYQRAQNQLVLEFYYPKDSVEVQVPVTKIQYDSLFAN